MSDDFDDHWERDAAYERDLHREPALERDAYLAHQAGPARCTRESHERLKADAYRWAALPTIGEQCYEPERALGDDWHPYKLVLKNCTACHSTLAVAVPL